MNYELRKGFTLIEMVVVIGIFAVVGAISVNMLFSTMKASCKAQVMNKVKQNGDYALAYMERSIRNATSVTTPSCATSGFPGTQLVINNQIGTTTTFSMTGTGISYGGSNNLTDSEVAVDTSATYSFTCTKADSAHPAQIDIAFTLKAAGNTCDNAQVPFQTKVILRNLF